VLKVFEFQVDVAAGDVAQVERMIERRLADVIANAGFGFDDLM
jgi:hypothetical protein